MANTNSPEPRSTPPTLQRGKACLRCRKRKMRCDGAKPACQQCTRAKKADGCEYDDGKGKTRTQLLRENILRLEQRIRELEDPEYTSPSVTLFNPHAHQRSESSSSSFVESPGSTFSATHSHSSFTSDSASSPQSWKKLSGVPSPSPSPFTDRSDQQTLPFEIVHMLLDIFESRRHQCGLKIHMGRLRESLTHSPTEQRHPVLLNAIFLWSCYFSRPGPLSQHESLYLSRSLNALNDGLRYSDKILDVIQASCLLSMYFLSNGRLLEGSYHASAAASLSLQWNLHRGIFSEDMVGLSEPLLAFDLGPSRDRVEEGERILTFWQVYNLDRCWSVILHKPSTIPDVQTPFSSINVPWPLEMEDYESGQIDTRHAYQTIRSFFEGQSSSAIGGFSTLALRVKASALFDRAYRCSANCDPRLPSNAYAENFQALEHLISRFTTTLVPIHQLDAALPEDKYVLLVVHSLCQTALIHLYYRLGQTDAIAYEKCLRAARNCVNIIKHLADRDFEYLDPIIGPCWTCAADVLTRELNNMESSWPLMHNADIRNELGTVLYAMNSLNARFPLLGYSAAKVQKRLAGI